MKHITRIAPAPTGMFHLGTARTALFNWLVAKATGGTFILRIDDTDTERNKPEAVNIIHESLAWLGLEPDLTFHQSDHVGEYRFFADLLVKEDRAYKDGDAIRLRVPADLPAIWNDTIAGEIAITDRDRQAIDGLVLIRSDGMPTYHFASVVDDWEKGVTWVLRGHDHISNTPKQIAIALALAAAEVPCPPKPFTPLWTHLGLITLAKKKLSKRDSAASMLTYRDEGIDPDAMTNWLLRLGWGPKAEDRTMAVIDRDRAIGMFLEGGNMRNSPANMDVALLAAFDRKYKAMKQKAARAELERAVAADEWDVFDNIPIGRRHPKTTD